MPLGSQMYNRNKPTSTKHWFIKHSFTLTVIGVIFGVLLFGAFLYGCTRDEFGTTSKTASGFYGSHRFVTIETVRGSNSAFGATGMDLCYDTETGVEWLISGNNAYVVINPDGTPKIHEIK